MHGLLRSVWDEPRPSGAPRRVWRDWLLVVVLLPAALLEGLLRPELRWPAVAVTVAVGLLPTLLWRRTRPLLMVTIAFGTCGVVPLLTGRDTLDLTVLSYVLLLAYALLRWGSGREIAVGSAVIVGKLGLGAAIGEHDLADLVAGFVVLFAVMALGAAIRYRAGSRQRELDQVKLLERERLARDLHDTVAHHVSAIAVRAQAGLAVAAARPEAATEALRVIEAEASRALAEMRGIVRVLRDGDPPELVPAPRVVDLDRLADDSRDEPPVEVEVVGDAGRLTPAVSSAVYRLAQESVTNARRHARRPTRIQVRVVVDDTTVRLRVADDGEPATVRPGRPTGYGLAGMAERAGLLGGTCEAGPGPEQGWIVTAVLPRAGAAV
ncbi:sensor histidine kinase [Polymorphospora rubra]|uniref:histidine kinase n=1 Tax=Polymorphospora rubra TaxID=338584 RepID=A0A810NCY2_9ACTN|nr:histidine kinase [Polymorphospora rubra]BCJ69738.1 two-component sensor histidine kinase [Polymorphospora rubra]